ncbi:murein L,D-transpeptidase [Arcobacter sp. LA11]|uniref:L,D-transpeptidase family protein n=1 Tax=Arcobacter sp. LA11 TaxID=1898176 RepID=UPI0009346178|nr:L,D-transpeptidase family protein [Arcobacter sp. LA11]
MKRFNIILVLLGILTFSYADINVEKEVKVFEENTNDKIVEEIIDLEKEFKNNTSIILKKLLKAKKIPSTLSRNLTKKYYRNFDYSTFWVNKEGIKPMAFSLIKSIEEDEVLKPYNQKLFKLNKINETINSIQTDENIDLKKLLTLDIMLTSTYHEYMRYLSRGFIDWKKFQTKLKSLNEKKEIIANWKKYSVKKNIRKLLYEAVKNDNIFTAIDQVNYTFPKAKELSNLIKEYEKIAQDGGYVKIPKIKKSLKKGNYYPEIKILRQRLLQSKDLETTNCIEKEEKKINLIEENLFKKEPQIVTTQLDKETATVEIKKEPDTPIKDCLELYDENVFQAVKSFQKNHGLVQDGVVGRNTVSRLNISIEKKIKKMRINLERMRWMPRTLGEKYLIVNIPDYKLKMYNNGEKKLDMAVVVGEYKNPTPIFSHKMSSIVLNPYWRIPQRIVKREIIPKLVEDPNYLTDRDIKVFENWSHKSMEFDMQNVDWSMYLDNDLIGNTQQAPMRFIQIPSNQNPLGRMKFMFPNRYSVYLHDTPYKRLFKNNKRAYSHGCIRLSRPHDLLKTIAEEDSRVDYTKAKEILNDIEKTDLDLTKKIPVHIVYLTSWIDDNGKVQFRDDIYRYDRMQGNLLYKKAL